MTGVFTINYPATMAVIDRMTKLVEKLKKINERYESKISTLSRCRGTTENPHNHDSQIAAYRKIINNNSKDIVDLGLLISQIFSLMINTKMTDFYLTQLIKNMMPGDSNVPNPETSVIGESLSEQAAAKAGVRVDSRGVPIINNGYDAKAYMDALNELMKQQPQIISNEHGSYYMKDGVPIITYTFPATSVGGRSFVYTSKELNLPEEQQLHIHKLCEGTNVDPLEILAIIAHESSSQPNAINADSGTTGLMQTYVTYTSFYFDKGGTYYNNSKETLDKAADYFTEEDIEILSNSSDAAKTQKQQVLIDPYANITLGILYLNQWNIDSNKYDEYDEIQKAVWALKGYTAYKYDSSSYKEDLYYTDQLRELLGEEPKYTEYYNKEFDQ